jgi:hypothetical protein
MPQSYKLTIRLEKITATPRDTGNPEVQSEMESCFITVDEDRFLALEKGSEMLSMMYQREVVTEAAKIRAGQEETE